MPFRMLCLLLINLHLKTGRKIIRNRILAISSWFDVYFVLCTFLNTLLNLGDLACGQPNRIDVKFWIVKIGLASMCECPSICTCAPCYKVTSRCDKTQNVIRRKTERKKWTYCRNDTLKSSSSWQKWFFFAIIFFVAYFGLCLPQLY